MLRRLDTVHLGYPLAPFLVRFPATRPYGSLSHSQLNLGHPRKIAANPLKEKKNQEPRKVCNPSHTQTLASAQVIAVSVVNHQVAAVIN